MERAIHDIEAELEEQCEVFQRRRISFWKHSELQRRTNFDIEMMRETGFCSGIENYSRHLAGLASGTAAVYAAELFPG